MPPYSKTREIAAPIVAKVIATVGRADIEVLRAALQAAYPFERRIGWPYEVWRSEIAKQVGVRKPPYLTQAEHDAMGDLFDAN